MYWRATHHSMMILVGLRLPVTRVVGLLEHEYKKRERDKVFHLRMSLLGPLCASVDFSDICFVFLRFHCAHRHRRPTHFIYQRML